MSAAKKKSGGFQRMGLSAPILKGVLRKGYRTPTPIQRKCIPIILDGKDVVAMARTGSGKTAAFLLPMFSKLKAHSAIVGARAIVLSPTRELAVQTAKFIKELAKFTDLRSAILVGGDSMEDHFSALHSNPDILVATPGRFLHLVIEMNLKLSSVEYVVLDEADRLFELGFAEQLNEILHRLPEERQTLLFSATIPKSLVEFARGGLSDPVLVRLDVESKLSPLLQMEFLSVPEHNKMATLLHLLQNVIPDGQLVVVFAASRHHVEYITAVLNYNGILATQVYSTLDYAARKINVAKFVSKKVEVLVVTDVAARGIDMPYLDNVINFNFPSTPKLYVHRVGRVARAGRSGKAFSLLSSEELPYLLDLELFLGKQIASTKEIGKGSIFGSVPPSVIAPTEDILQTALTTSHDLELLKRTAENGFKQYSKSKPLPSLSSTKRAKEIKSNIQLHPMFKQSMSEDETLQISFLDDIRAYKPKQTIFEATFKTKSLAVQVMKEKRGCHDTLVAEEKVRPLSSVDETTVAMGTRKKGEEYINYVGKDEKFEKGLSLESGSFEQTASQAALDMTADDSEGLKRRKETKKWDRKRKKFVGVKEDQKNKKVKTEMGTWVKASFKGNVYKKWTKKHKTNALQLGSEENAFETARHLATRPKHFKGRRWHTLTKEDLTGKNKLGRLRTKEEIIKLRKLKIKEKFKNLPKSKRQKLQAKRKHT